tara:strand:- start:76 stop:435 length:360 start_codon:yes stop_codon:yes gene_type:complete
MSNQPNSFSSPLNDHIVKRIDELNLSIIQKHHIRLLAHCLAIFKQIAKEDMSSLDEDILREWCENQSRKFNDKKFNKLFYEQMSSAAKKLSSFSITLEKNFKELALEDLIALVQQNNES